MTPASTHAVMPDLIRHPASSRATTEGSETPDQVRGDAIIKARATPLEADLAAWAGEIWRWLLRRPDGTVPLILAATYFTVACSMILGLGHPRYLFLSPSEMGQLENDVMELAKPLFRLAIFLGLLGYVIRAISFIGSADLDQKIPFLKD